VGLSALLGVLVMDAVMLLALRGRPLSLGSALLSLALVASLPALAVLGYWTYAYWRMGYQLSRDGLVIRWGVTRHVVPMGAISHVLAGRPASGKLSGLSWAGSRVGRAQIEDVGETLYCVTAGVEGQLLVLTPGQAYAISPADRRAFVADFELRRRLGPSQALEQRSLTPLWARPPFVSDRLAMALLLATAAVSACLLLWLAWQYPALPPPPAELPLQFAVTADGAIAVERTGTRLGLFYLPLVGVAATLVNLALGWLVHERYRPATVVLFGGALVVQLGVAVVLARSI
jgi:hypothetical protein